MDKWFSKGEGDKQIVRELIPTDEKGHPLKGALDGKHIYNILAIFLLVSLISLEVDPIDSCSQK